MQRNIGQLANNSYDLLVVGGGIYGACIAWDAVSRGLSVALVDKGDFGAATSANSLKIIHGGLRYLQHADFKRMRESIRERKNLLRIAPHLIHPLPILIPTYGHGMKGREAMNIALRLNDLISCDRNWSMADASKHIPSGKVISPQECLTRLPGIESRGLTGGALFCDAQVYNSERLTLAFLHSANKAGAEVANYVQVTGFTQHQNRVTGAIARDELSGNDFEIQAKVVVNTAGPWVNRLQDLALPSSGSAKRSGLAKAVNLVVKPIFNRYAVGLSSQNQYRDQDAFIDKGSRFLFTAPWRGRSMVGTWYFPYDRSPDQLGITADELKTCLDDINSAYPPAQLTEDDIQFIHCGLLPSSGISAKTGDVQLAKHYSIHDYTQQGLAGLISVQGVKYTTARDVAEKVVNQLSQYFERLPRCQTAQVPLHGGNILNLDSFLHSQIQRLSPHLTAETVQRLVYNYGSECTGLLGTLDLETADVQTALLTAEVRHAVQKEMAQHLTDVILRRTELGSAGRPDQATLELCASVMAEELGWDAARHQTELQEAERFYAARMPQAAAPTEPVLRS